MGFYFKNPLKPCHDVKNAKNKLYITILKILTVLNESDTCFVLFLDEVGYLFSLFYCNPRKEEKVTMHVMVSKKDQLLVHSSKH